MDTLEELQEITRKSAKVSHDDVINMVRAPAEELAKREIERQEAEDEAFVRLVGMWGFMMIIDNELSYWGFATASVVNYTTTQL